MRSVVRKKYYACEQKYSCLYCCHARSARIKQHRSALSCSIRTYREHRKGSAYGRLNHPTKNQKNNKGKKKEPLISLPIHPLLSLSSLYFTHSLPPLPSLHFFFKPKSKPELYHHPTRPSFRSTKSQTPSLPT